MRNRDKGRKAQHDRGYTLGKKREYQTVRRKFTGQLNQRNCRDETTSPRTFLMKKKLSTLDCLVGRKVTRRKRVSTFRTCQEKQIPYNHQWSGEAHENLLEKQVQWSAPKLNPN